jgi:hypothetical protein
MDIFGDQAFVFLGKRFQNGIGRKLVKKRLKRELLWFDSLRFRERRRTIDGRYFYLSKLMPAGPAPMVFA